MEGEEDRRILRLLADELDAVCGRLERLGGVLCDNITLNAELIVELQALDDIGQRQAAIARILRAADLPQAAQGITLESIRRRLGTACPGNGNSP
ncbi:MULTISPECIES: hypothetical protein [Sphingomonadales]|uniref:Uncharacterized protein n=2 Tax=Edaphosphingomonas TaxID=3423724 RepID=A0A2T4I6H0_9SPHN|nr:MULTISPECIES: hypothetical protein [Sphingomonas]AGH48292.1 hypothetical protein G432_02825 [Sphingomonas sp. MM-1]OHT20764.1 hypothetical protein BHE75_02766 [Sphingomonas haloaromaticamans]PTD26202.1 hypothetical protein CV103_04190 [Sphingomonas fennica]